MPEPEDIEIQAKNIDAAAGEIIAVLEDTSKGNVIYFRGWCGFGASAALRVVAQRLKSSKSKFDKVIHVDCSVWKSMRALQKAVAEELDLPRSVMAIFDRCDEDDDFNGIEQGSRGLIADVGREIYANLAYSRFVVIFHNGSGRYIDIYECGVPAIPFLRNKVLWTWHGRFRLGLMLGDGEQEKMRMQTNVYLRTSLGYEDEELRDLVREEAEEVANCTRIADPDYIYINQKVVKQCFLYGWALRNIISRTCMYLGTHVPNYWICDGIVQGQDYCTSAWEIGDSLQRNMNLDWVGKKPINLAQTNEAASHLARLLMRNNDVDDDRWVYITHQNLRWGDTGVLPPVVTSFFFFPDEPPNITISVLPVSMLQCSQNSKLRVLYLSRCTFSFASPPFHCCSQLRLLHLDHCTSTDRGYQLYRKSSPADEEYQSNDEYIPCFQKLQVVDLRYTDWYWILSEKMISLMTDLKELNVEGIIKYWRISDCCGGRPGLVMLRVTDNDLVSLPNLSNASLLKTVILERCFELEQVDPDMLPPSLESFSFVNSVTTAAKISSISFQGCSQLKSIELRGCLGSLEVLDLSGTSVKTLDLRDVEAPNLKCLILMGCENLCAILWPPEKPETEMTQVPQVLESLQINTIRSALPSQANISKEKTNEASSATKSSSILAVAATQPVLFYFERYVAVRDARLLWSLEHLLKDHRDYIYHWDYIYIEMDSSLASTVAVGGREVAQRITSLEQPDHYSYARDIADDLQDGAGNEGTIGWIWACPPRPPPVFTDWYVHIQDEHEMKVGLLQEEYSSMEGTTTSATLPPSFVCGRARLLHVHDSSSMTCIPCPQGERWDWLEWCLVERCPKLCSVFAPPQLRDGWETFWRLSTFWASQLPKACYIWNWSAVAQPGSRSFQDLAFLHLDYCLRLIHVLPLSEHMDTLPSLETLEIVCCGDLKEVFPLGPKHQQQLQKTIKFPKLRRIHLYQLSALESICGSRMSAPNLETVKVRDCWGLRRLPAVSGSITERPKVDCEKDWWDNLEWDGVKANHDPSLYESRHSRYFKDHLPRGTVLM